MRTVDSHEGPRYGDPRHPLVKLALAALIAASALASACKPADEAPRQARRAAFEAAPSTDGDQRARPSAPTADDFAAPLGHDPVPTLNNPDPSPDPFDGADVVDDTSEAPQSEIEALLAPVSRELEEKARALNTAALRKHRKQDIRGAIASYREALDAWPGHLLARYNLACALALVGESDEALAEIQRLHDLNAAGADAAEVLAKARTDADLTALRADARFRKLTGSTDIVVAFARGDASAESEARRAISALGDAHWPARLAGEDGLDPTEGAGIEVLESDLTAARAATEVGAVIGVRRVVLVPRMTGSAIRVIFPGAIPPPADAPGEDGTEPAPTADVPPADAPSAPATGDPASLESWFGPRLTGSHDGRTHQLQLKATGFFEWRITESSGRLEVRLGRYRATASSIVFTYRRTVTTPAEGESQPDIAVDEDQVTEHSARASTTGLELDGVVFRR